MRLKISSKLFGRNPIYNDPLMEFVLRTQLQKETIFQFMFELENLAAKAYLQHDDRFREPIIVYRFIRGLRDNRVQTELCQMETIETIQEVLDKANQLEIGFQKCKQIIEFKNSRTNEMESRNNYNSKITKVRIISLIETTNIQTNSPKIQNLKNKNNFYYNTSPNLNTKNVRPNKVENNHQLKKQLHNKFNSHQNSILPTNNTTFLHANEQQISN
ncbi:unnamed protein product [Brachionus calyciflorus]|uniref:Uncharacterized protein n=1 Tax=Brachionus calyciflorus TaxID=104777 RepID=A0A813MBR1_9BILA|nr:unnamed protein product [Brachionus calyciflorus]